MLPDRTTDAVTEDEPLVAVFDTKTVALRAIEELRAAEFDDIWLSVVRGETDAGETIVSGEGNSEGQLLLCRALAERGTPAALANRFDGILPPGTAVLSLRMRSHVDDAIFIIELAGGHIDHH